MSDIHLHDINEDTDLTRRCQGCGVRPRWSKAGNCRYCVECNPRSVKTSLRVRKYDGPRPIPKRQRGNRERYRALRLAGCSASEACVVSHGSRKTAAWLETHAKR